MFTKVAREPPLRAIVVDLLNMNTKCTVKFFIFVELSLRKFYRRRSNHKTKYSLALIFMICIRACCLVIENTRTTIISNFHIITFILLEKFHQVLTSKTTIYQNIWENMFQQNITYTHIHNQVVNIYYQA